MTKLWNEISGEKACCYGCYSKGSIRGEILPGHFLCRGPSDEMLKKEARGEVYRALVGGPGSPEGPQRWAWFRSS